MPTKKKAAAKKTAVPQNDIIAAITEAPAAPAKKAARKKAAAPAASASGVFEGEALARAAAGFAYDKKAENIAIMDVRGLSTITDFIVICEGGSMPQLRSIQNEISDRMREDHKVRAYACHGTADSGWLLLDFGDVIIHIFHGEKRSYYAIDELWNDAPRLL